MTVIEWIALYLIGIPILIVTIVLLAATSGRGRGYRPIGTLPDVPPPPTPRCEPE